MFFSERLGLELLEATVREGRQPGNPELLESYLRLSNLNTSLPISQQQTLNRRNFETLLETICDHCVSPEWRSLCLDHVHRPLIRLGELARNSREKQQVRRQYAELALLSHYFCTRC